MNAISSTFCSLAWTHLFVGPRGKVKPCCRFSLGGKELRGSPEEIFRGEFLQELRTNMMLGKKSPGCRRCYEEEEAGKRASLRQYYNSIAVEDLGFRMEQPTLRFLELGFSNLCNSACVMCDANYSTLWAGTTKNHSAFIAEDFYPLLEKIQHIKFTGGEPFLIREYTKILEKIVELGVAKNVYLNYSTNLTVKPSSKLIEIWKKFKGIEIACSLDGVGEVNEYVRYPTKWHTTERVVATILQLSKEMNLRCGLRSTVMIYNVLNMPETLNWWAEQVEANYLGGFREDSWMNATHVTFPEFLSLPALNAQSKEFVQRKIWNAGHTEKTHQILNHLCKYMMSSDLSHHIPNFLDYTQGLEKVRGNSFAKIYPELFSLTNQPAKNYETLSSTTA